ncbi:cupin domain-containing protein [Pseudoalteromonas luteoviolacea]|uniref:cupin domain-containing protein n=1 Tax=Pseudoalteromonas luteoviolacea TaxID=43657 RepID=UPI001F1D2DE8|nr:cupin domain-containing protein [Pseudoalteromonas luteoviolacea]MCF6439543.1 cupin domain-containing protein [Pseudoalteromonas luteoviolacea]
MKKDKNGIVINYPDSGRYLASAGNLYRIMISGEQTEGQFSLIESLIQPGQGGPFHTHANEQESFLVISGTLTIFDAEQSYQATPGTFILCPAGTTRGFRNDTEEEVKVLILYTPAGIEKMIKMEGEELNQVEDYQANREGPLSCPVLNQEFGIVEDKQPLPSPL